MRDKNAILPNFLHLRKEDISAQVSQRLKKPTTKNKPCHTTERQMTDKQTI